MFRTFHVPPQPETTIGDLVFAFLSELTSADIHELVARPRGPRATAIHAAFEVARDRAGIDGSVRHLGDLL
jgi:hypothetical protein